MEIVARNDEPTLKHASVSAKDQSHERSAHEVGSSIKRLRQPQRLTTHESFTVSEKTQLTARRTIVGRYSHEVCSELQRSKRLGRIRILYSRQRRIVEIRQDGRKPSPLRIRRITDCLRRQIAGVTAADSSLSRAISLRLRQRSGRSIPRCSCG
jgi:hypothetical protein